MRATRSGIVGLVLALAAADAGAGERWLEVRSPHFRLVTDAGERDGRAVATGFEQLRSLFLALGNLRVDSALPIDIVATRDEAGLRELLPAYWERRGGVRPAGVFLTGDEGHHVVVRLDVDPEHRDDIVYHEYVHLITRLNFTALPVWLSEGLAEFYAGTTVRDGNVLCGRVDAAHLALLRRRAPLPLADLFAIDGSSREYNEESRASVLYAESALLTHYLLVGDNGAHRDRLTEYLRLLGGGASPTEAQSAFGELRALEKGFFSYVHRTQFVAVSVPLDVAGTTAAVRALSGAEVLVVRGELLAAYGRQADARPLLTRARALEPQLAAAAEALGRLESRSDDPAAARPHLDDAVRLAPDDFMAHYLWARGVARSQADAQLPAVEAALRRSLQLRESFAPAHSQLSVALRRQGKLEAAFLSLNRACELDPDNGTYWLRRAALLRELGRGDVADRIEAQIAQMAGADPRKLAELAAFHHEQGRLDELERILRKATDLNPHSALAPRMLAGLLNRQGRLDEAEAAYRRALTAQPDNAVVLNELAYLNADRAERLPEALAMIERALKTYPDSAAMLDTKGWVLFRLGRLDEAERVLRRALAAGDDPEILEHLGDVLEGRGQTDAARDMWARALQHPAVSRERARELGRKLGTQPTGAEALPPRAP